MALERLITREKPESITAGRIVRIDTGGKRILVSIRGGAEVWAGYDPTLFSALASNDDVLIAKSGSTGYLIERIPRSRPDQVVIITV